jgi:hypothetical protein
MEDASVLRDGCVLPKLRVGVPLLVRASTPRVLGVVRQVFGASFDGPISPLRGLCGDSGQLVVFPAKHEEGQALATLTRSPGRDGRRKGLGPSCRQSARNSVQSVVSVKELPQSERTPTHRWH